MEIRLYLDEHVPEQLAPYLRRRSYDVQTTSQAGRASQKVDDEEQLRFATREGRVILMFNHRDFAPLDAEWKARGHQHAGIIMSPRLEPGQLCRRVEAHLRRHTAEEHYNLLL